MGVKFELVVVYLLVVLYALCYQLQAPVEPFLVEKLIGKDGDGAAAYGKLQSFFSFIQTIGSLSFGHLLDRFGVRVGFAVNFVACALQYGILASTTSIDMLWASKLPGVAMAGFLCAQAAISRLTEEGSERVTALGRLTTAYTVRA
jgi:OCT family organic cation transporter-like MFS transporter 18